MTIVTTQKELVKLNLFLFPTLADHTGSTFF